MTTNKEHSLFHKALLSHHKALLKNLITIDPQADKWGKYLFLESAQSGDLRNLKLLFDAGIPVDTSDQDGRTALHHAVMEGNIETVRLLIVWGADPNQWWLNNRYGAKMLFVRAARNHTEIFKILLAKGWEIDTTDSEGRSFLMWAASTGRYEDSLFLVNHGADILRLDIHGLSSFSLASGYGHISIAEMLLRTAKGWIGKEGFDGVEALRIAIRGVPRIQAISWLLQNGVDVSGRKNGLLINPSGLGHLDIVKMLIKAGADVNDRHITGFRALDIAASMGHSKVVRFLIESGAEIDAVDTFGETAILKAVQNAHLPVIKILLEMGSNPNQVDYEGKGLVDWAVDQSVAHFLEHYRRSMTELYLNKSILEG